MAFALGADAPVVRVAGPVSRAGEAPVSADAPWHIGSITKSFTAALIQRLVAQGALSLDQPVGTYLPRDRAGMHEDWQAVTLRQLLSHTARLPADPPHGTLADRRMDGIHEVRREVLGKLWSTPLTGAPGSYLYSNMGYVLAGFVAEEVTAEADTAVVEEKPKRKRAPRKKKVEEAATDGEAAVKDTAKAPAPKDPEPAMAEAAADTATVVETKDPEQPKPKRRGWWSLGRS